LGATENCTSELPPDPDDVIVIHDALLDDVQPQTPGAMTRTDPDPPEAGAEPDDESSEKLHVVPACERSTVWPAIVSAPDREPVDAAFDEIVTPIAPLPVPDGGVTDAHETSLDAVHEQLGPLVVTPIVPVVPPDPNGVPSPVVLMVTLQGSASCVIWNTCPPIVSVPVRENVVEFGSTE
jgi:hypothetical protein